MSVAARRTTSRDVGRTRGGGARVRPSRLLALRVVRLAKAAIAPAGRRLAAWKTRREPPRLALVDVRRRLELLVAALHDRAIPVEAWPAPPSDWFSRVFQGPQPLLALPATDGDRIRLPAALDATAGADLALARYRLLALLQAERVVRGTAQGAPPDRATDPRARLERELYHVAESAAIDAALARRVPGMRKLLDAARREARAARIPIDQFPPVERAVEGLVRHALGADVATSALAPDGGEPLALPVGRTPGDSRAWARATATRLHRVSRGYGGVPDVVHWGVLLARGPAGEHDADAPEGTTRGAKSGVVGRTATSRSGDTMGSEGRLLMQDGRDARRADEGAAAPDLQAPDGAPLDPVDAASRVVPRPDGGAAVLARYPEWDHELGRDVPQRVLVRERVAREGTGTWATSALALHAALVRRVRERFERLRARRLRLPRQRDGQEFDMDAVARALVDRRMGHAMDDRLWIAADHGRRGLAIALLVDVSGSTETRVTPTQRVIDVEREAVLLASEAFDALGDRYGIFSFSGHGARDVRVGTLKGFAERNGDAVRRRIAGMAADGNTRLGAAVRHATALLARESAGHRLVLIVSDGRPNDVDRYFEQYAVEDSRRAVIEARAAGMLVFCLTVDRAEGEEYLPRIFGASGFTILRHPEQLPKALLGVVRQMLGRTI